MNAAIITPLPGGRAEFSWRGIDQTFASTADALAEVNRRGIRCQVQPFPELSFPEFPVEVLAVSPALQAS